MSDRRPPGPPVDPSGRTRALHWFWAIIALALVLPGLTEVGAFLLRVVGADVHTSRSILIRAHDDLWIGVAFILVNALPLVLYTFVAWGLLEVRRAQLWTVSGGVAGLVAVLVAWNVGLWTVVPEALVLLLNMAVLPVLIVGAAGAAIGMAAGSLLARLVHARP